MVVFAGVCLRLAVMFAYRPALFFGDSWGYVATAFSGQSLSGGSPVVSNFRPSGYPVLAWLLSKPGRDIVQLVAFQHLAGVLIGVLIYLALRRAGIARWGAALASAIVLLDGYAITLEQYVMADTFFALTLSAACLVMMWPRLGGRAEDGAVIEIGRKRIVAVGVLLALATLERLQGLFAIPLIAIYLVWGQVGWRRVFAFLVALALPLLGYAALEDHYFGTFGLSQWSGWTEYARVAGFADCTGAGVAPVAKPLCESAAQRASHPDAPVWYMFDPASPALRLFGPISRSTPEQRRSDAILGAFARRIVLHQPLRTLSVVTLDFLRFFAPGTAEFDDATGATALPATVAGEDIVETLRARYLPAVHPTVDAPSAVMRSYRSVIHLPRPLLAIFAIASCLAVAMRLRAGREVLLLSGVGLALFAGTAATAGFAQRYVLCAVPLLTVGGSLALRDLADRRRNHSVDSRGT